MVWWANADCRIESFLPGQSGYLVDRRAFDRRLRRLAAESGAHVRTGIVRKVEGHEEHEGHEEGREGDHEPGPVNVELEVALNGERQILRSAFVLDCSGRAGVIARRGMREPLPSPRTVALVGAWRARDRWPEASDAHTLVASYADGWAWSVPTEPGLRYFTVMIQPGLTGLADGSAGDRYVTELAKIPPFRKLLDSATPAGGPWGADASLYTSRTFAGAGFLLVGDAGSFIDPLSSFGVKKALVSGWLAAITVHTSLTNAGMRREALQFFDRRERQMAAGSRLQSGQFAADAAAGTPHPFWVGRAAVSHDSPGLGDDVDPAALARDPSVLAAFEDLRRRERVHVMPGSGARIEPRPMVRGREIVLEDQLLVPACPDGIRYLRGVDLLELGRLAPQFTDVGQIYEAQRRAQPDIALPDFLGALSVLIAWDVLQHPESARR
ncbi:MAG TPA: tryptophan 7-halogenase [Vicinamibacterales bacterium]